MSEDVRHCLRNLIELCNPHLGTNFDMDVAESLLDVAMEGRLKIIYDNGEVFFQESTPTMNKGEN